MQLRTLKLSNPFSKCSKLYQYTQAIFSIDKLEAHNCDDIKLTLMKLIWLMKAFLLYID